MFKLNRDHISTSGWIPELHVCIDINHWIWNKTNQSNDTYLYQLEMN